MEKGKSFTCLNFDLTKYNPKHQNKKQHKKTKHDNLIALQSNSSILLGNFFFSFLHFRKGEKQVVKGKQEASPHN